MLGKLSIPGVLLIWVIVGQGLTALAVSVDWGCSNISFSLSGKRPDID